MYYCVTNVYLAYFPKHFVNKGFYVRTYTMSKTRMMVEEAAIQEKAELTFRTFILD